MNHCSALYQDITDTHIVELAKLSPMTWKDDNRWYWRDLPRIMGDGLWYPLLYYKVTPEWWNGGFANTKSAFPSWQKINPPVINDDGMIWALKMGTNRLQALKFMGYTHCDAICFDNSDDLIRIGLWFREEDPLHA